MGAAYVSGRPENGTVYIFIGTMIGNDEISTTKWTCKLTFSSRFNGGADPDGAASSLRHTTRDVAGSSAADGEE